MVKFLSGFREKVVLEFLNGEESSRSLAKRYGIGSHQTILNWVNQFKEYGGSSFDIRSPKYDYDGKKAMALREQYAEQAIAQAAHAAQPSTYLLGTSFYEDSSAKPLRLSQHYS